MESDRGGARQGSFQVAESGTRVFDLHRDVAEVEQDERIIGALGELSFEDSPVAEQLAAPQGRVVVADMTHHDIGPAHLHPGAT